MANTLLTNDIISKTALMEFKNNLVFAKTVNRQFQEDYNVTTGSTIRIRKPTRYTVVSGPTISGVEDIDQRVTSLTIAYQDVVPVAVTSQQLALQLDDFNREVIKPAMLQLANKVDQRLYSTTNQIYNFVGTAGTAPNSFGVVNNAAAQLTQFGVLNKPRYALFSPNDGASVQNALYNTFNTEFNREIILDGMMGNLAGFDCYQVQNNIQQIYSSVEGTSTPFGTPVINGSTVSGATTLNMSGFTPSITNILLAGAVFEVVGVGSVNPITRQATGKVMQFVVTANVSSDSSGHAVVPISPAIVFDGGPYVNVTALPLNAAAVNFEGSHTINVAYHPEGFSLAVIKLPDSNQNGAYQRTMVDTDANVSIRMTRQYNFLGDADQIRFDVLYGVLCNPEYCTRILGSFDPTLV